jgi:hypothetical protein
MAIVVGTNGYIDLEGAEQYFSERLHARAWTEASESDKEKGLIQATRAIDRLYLKGRKAEAGQLLAFPRYPDKEIPKFVQYACCEEALALLERGNSIRLQLQKEGVKSVSIGNTSETFIERPIRGLLSSEAWEYLRPWIARSVLIS